MVGSAGSRVDPTQIQISDLIRAEGDALLVRTRKELRANHGFSHSVNRRFDVPCVFSKESQRYPTKNGQISTTKAECSNASGLNRANEFGSVSAVTACFGMIATAYALNKIAEQAQPLKL